MKTGLVYMATSKTSGKSYIGKTVDFDKRIKKYLRSAFNSKTRDYKNHFHNAIRKYGFEDFTWKVLADNIPVERLDLEEILAIYVYNTFYEGYNSTMGGEGSNGFKHTEEAKRKVSLANSGRNHTKEAKKNMSMSHKGNKNSFYGKQHTEETKKKLSEFRTGLKQSEEQVNKKSGKWKIIRPDGTEEIILNLRKYCRNNNLLLNCMHKISKGNQNHHKNYKCYKLEK